MLINEVDISNYLGIKKKSDRKFESSQSHLAEKITNHVGLTASAIIKERENPDGKTLLHKDESSLERK